MVFGLITEVPTDQIVLRHILAAFFSDPDIDIRPVQPNTDSTDELEHFGGWQRVLDYCENSLQDVIDAYDYVIIQIDTDVCEEFGVNKRVAGAEVTEQELIDEVKKVLITHLGNVYVTNQQKIIFAISHGTIECWLLPFYFTNNDRNKLINCCQKLNQALIKKGFTIDCDDKAPLYYYKVCKPIKRKNDVENHCVYNLSFGGFVDQLRLIDNV